MNLMRNEELELLLKKRQGPCVSLFIPTFRSGRQVEQNRIRFKNSLRQADERLRGIGMRQTERADLLRPGNKLLDENSFWRRQREGLATFLCKDDFRYYRLPFSFSELVAVSDQFHLKPLIPILAGTAQFYILALSKNAVRLLEGSRFEVSEIDLNNVPAGLAEALKYDYFERQLQFHTGAPGRAGKRDAVFFGTGAGDPDFKDAILRYFQQVDKGLRELLRDKQAPLVVAGVDYLHPIFHEASKYSGLTAEGITGNPESLSASQLHERAWRIVEPLLLSSQIKAAEKFQQQAGNGKMLASSDLEIILPAAVQSRIESLFVAVGVQRWGVFDRHSGNVTLHEKPEPGDHDLLDIAAIQAHTSGAAVYAVEPGQVPGGGPIAAVFRY